jgi:hypothetical protein
LPTTLSPKTVQWALEHFARHNDTDIFHKPFEFDALYHAGDQLIKRLAAQDIVQWTTRPLRLCLVPKQRYGFRLATQLDPLDMLFYFAIFLEAGERIEKARLGADRRIAFSHRFRPDDSNYLVFDRDVRFAEFRLHCKELAEKYPFVVVTDISDFYPRIYQHRLESALSKALPALPFHVKAFINLLKGWYQKVSYGIPIGNTPSRLLAEIAIDDVDRMLLAEGIVFARYVDDYRIFCKSRQEAYKCLVRLANGLYASDGLTLQAQKTKILTSQEFVEQVLETAAQRELHGLLDGFEGILQELGIDNPYEDIDYFQLAPEIRQKIDGLNLESLLHQQLGRDEIDIPMTRFLINRLGQIKRSEPLDALLAAIDNLHPVLPEIIRYVAEIGGGLSESRRQHIGDLLLSKLTDSVLGNLDFNKMQIMALFAGSNQWGNAENLAGYYGAGSGSFFQRTLLLALGKNGQDYWLREKRVSLDQMPPWERRAFLYAASCLQKDERTHWYNAVLKSRDELEKYIIPWALKNPIA